MSIQIPLKAIEGIGKLIYEANAQTLVSSAEGVRYTLKLSPDWTILKSPSDQSIIRHDGITESVLTEALVRCYVYDVEKEPNYRVQLTLKGMDPENKMKPKTMATYWVGRDGHHAWISVQHEGTPVLVRFELAKLDSR